MYMISAKYKNILVGSISYFYFIFIKKIVRSELSFIRQSDESNMFLERLDIVSLLF